jgi:anti-sigma-K factor RskA
MTTEELQERCALYVLGALEATEAADLEARLRAGEPEVLQEVARLQTVVHHLPYALPPVAPDPAVRHRLMQRLQAAAPETSSVRGPQRRLWVWIPRLVAALLILALGGMVYTLRRQVNDLQAANQQLRQTAAGRQQLLTLLASPQVTIIVLSGSVHAPHAGARLLWNTQNQEWTVVTHDLPPLPPGKAYQLWVLTAGAPQPFGTFRPQNGYGLIQAQLSLAPGDVAGAAISVEPEQGVLQPTGDIVLVGKF